LLRGFGKTAQTAKRREELPGNARFLPAISAQWLGGCRLLADVQFFNQGTVTLNIAFLQIIKEAVTLADHLVKAAAGMVIFFMDLQVLRQDIDTLCKNSNLYFR
jgi:hypothetical protein